MRWLIKAERLVHDPQSLLVLFPLDCAVGGRRRITTPMKDFIGLAGKTEGDHIMCTKSLYPWKGESGFLYSPSARINKLATRQGPP